MSSSNRGSINRDPTYCEAAIYRDQKPVGPVRMPMKKRASFVAEFNRVYKQTGITIYHVPDDEAEEVTPIP
jgi:hypothetical protein